MENDNFKAGDVVQHIETNKIVILLSAIEIDKANNAKDYYKIWKPTKGEKVYDNTQFSFRSAIPFSYDNEDPSHLAPYSLVEDSLFINEYKYKDRAKRERYYAVIFNNRLFERLIEKTLAGITEFTEEDKDSLRREINIYTIKKLNKKKF